MFVCLFFSLDQSAAAKAAKEHDQKLADATNEDQKGLAFIKEQLPIAMGACFLFARSIFAVHLVGLKCCAVANPQFALELLREKRVLEDRITARDKDTATSVKTPGQ